MVEETRREGVHVTTAKQRACLALVLSAVFAACLDDLQEVSPVAKLLAPEASLEVASNTSTVVAVQAIDANDDGVNGARVAFLRGDSSQLVFEGQDESADSTAVTTTTAPINGVSSPGVASIRVRPSSSAQPGDTTILAIVKGPTDDVNAAISLRLKVAIVAGSAGAAGTGGAAGSAGAGGTSGDSGAGGTAGGSTNQADSQEGK